VSRREAWLSAAAVFAIALVVRIVAAAAVVFPVPEDTAYYAGVARNLAEGRGLISDALWSYQTQPLVVPRAAFEVWMPLPSLLEAVPIFLAGAANWFRAAQLVSVLAGSVVAVLAWRLGADVAAEMRLPVGRARTMGVGTGLVAAVLGPLVIFGALPDSTAVFAALSLAACLLMTRIAAREVARGDGTGAGDGSDAPGEPAGAGSGPASASGLDRRLIALGLVLGLAALTRSEAIWLALAWAAVVWFWTPGTRRRRAGLIAVPAVVAILIFVPWAVRDWLAFGTPLPGQTIANALYLHITDVFAYRDQPSLARYLAQGPATLAGLYVGGIANDLFSVLLIPAFPVGLVGLLALPWSGRRQALRPLLLASIFTFVVTSLVFPVATQSGTYLHAAGSAFVLLTISCIVALDEFIVRIGRIRHWTRPVAWLGPAFAIAAVGPLCVVTVTGMASQAGDVQARYQVLPAAMARAGVPLDGSSPVITDNPIWLAEAARVPALALPEESPEAVLALARQFGAKILIVRDGTDREWPDILSQGGAAATCFQEVPIADISGMGSTDDPPLTAVHVFRITCP
jgi:hypothetical protein